MQIIEGRGAHIPAIGLGTWDLRGRDCAHMVEQALQLGYRHIDTAEMYDNEREVGEGLRAAKLRPGRRVRDHQSMAVALRPGRFREGG